MSEQIDYRVLLETAVITAKKAAQAAARDSDPNSKAMVFAYCDVLDAVKQQAEVMSIPLDEIGLEGFDPYALATGKKAV